uniref:Uncharacterized protein n=1 Tax=Arundo donax TaxID=35708 RepID=A0A0A9U6M4_ARUDO
MQYFRRIKFCSLQIITTRICNHLF